MSPYDGFHDDGQADDYPERPADVEQLRQADQDAEDAEDAAALAEQLRQVADYCNELQDARAAALGILRTTTPPPQAAPPSDSPIWTFAASLNPKGGALGDALPFTLTGQRARPRPEPVTLDLFTNDSEDTE